jgi:CheY-like chemotaxis protein
MSFIGARADVICSQRGFPVLTQSGHAKSLLATQNNSLAHFDNPLARHLGVGMVCVPRNPFMRNVRLDRGLFAAISEPPSGIEHDRILFLSNRELVFVVDDDPAMLRGVARVLKQHGYDTILFASAEAFRSYIDYERAACIILDVNLNAGTGIELRRGLKAAGIDVPVIYMTANDSPAVRAAALQSGCLAYLEKPFSPKSLIEPIKQASAGLVDALPVTKTTCSS